MQFSILYYTNGLDIPEHRKHEHLIWLVVGSLY